jgi:hypothetical protein
MSTIRGCPTAPASSFRSAVVRLLLLPLVLLLTTHVVLVGGVSAVADIDLHYARRLAACPIGTYSANGLDSPSACQQVAAGYYPSQTATISTPVTSDGLWSGITASPDFRFMAATLSGNGDYYGNIYMSKDSGVTWTVLTGTGSRRWTEIASTPDFINLAAIDQNGSNIYFSSDGGTSWTAWTSAGVKFWYGITCSPDFSLIAATVFGDYIYLSVNGGVTWSALTGTGKRYWTGVTASPDFVKMAACTLHDYIKISTDSGVTWITITGAGGSSCWRITSSPDFTKLAVTDNDSGSIYFSTDSGCGSGNWNMVRHHSLARFHQVCSHSKRKFNVPIRRWWSHLGQERRSPQRSGGGDGRGHGRQHVSPGHVFWGGQR